MAAIKLPKGLLFSKAEKERMMQVRIMPYSAVRLNGIVFECLQECKSNFLVTNTKMKLQNIVSQEKQRMMQFAYQTKCPHTSKFG